VADAAAGPYGDVQDDDQYDDVRDPKTGGPYRAPEDYGGLPGVYGGVRYGDGDDGAYRTAGPRRDAGSHAGRDPYGDG
jgi:hypothetical protein